MEVITPSKLSLLVDRATSSLSLSSTTPPTYSLPQLDPFTYFVSGNQSFPSKASPATFLQSSELPKIYCISSHERLIDFLSSRLFNPLYPGYQKFSTTKRGSSPCEYFSTFLLILTTVDHKSVWNLCILPNWYARVDLRRVSR